MLITHLGRELKNRRRETVIIAIGMALAIALVILVNAVSIGVKNAQASALQSVYGWDGRDRLQDRDRFLRRAALRLRIRVRLDQRRQTHVERLAPDHGDGHDRVRVLRDRCPVADEHDLLRFAPVRLQQRLGRDPAQRGNRHRGGSSSTSGPRSFGVTSVTVLGYDTDSTSTGPISSTP